MDCWLCNAKLTEDQQKQLVATVHHVWAKCCTACRAKYGEKDENRRLVTKEDKH